MLRLLVVADIGLYREGLNVLLSSVDDIEVVATAGSSDQALERLAESRPDTVLVDRTLPDSLTLIARLRAAAPEITIVILTVEEVETEIVPCAEAGIDGYVPRGGSTGELVKTICASQRGELRCSPKTAGSLLRRVSQLAAQRHPVSTLTPRELEVLGFIERGMSNRKISKSLGIELATVKNHVHNILEKLHVERRGEAAALLRRDAGAAPAADGGLDPRIHPPRHPPR